MRPTTIKSECSMNESSAGQASAGLMAKKAASPKIRRI